MKTNRTIPSLLLAGLAALCLSTGTVAAQSFSVLPPSPGVSQSDTGPTAQITMADGTGVSLKLRGRHGRRVLFRSGGRATILLQYDGSFAGVPVQIAALDGGKPSFVGNRNVVDANGEVVLQFSEAQAPGLYRVSVDCGGLVSILQFWIANPDGSGGDASIKVPVPTSTSTR